MSDTIAAISTGLTEAGISMIRVSGDNSIEITDKIFRPGKKGMSLKEAETHTIHYGHILDEEGNVLDEVMVSVMKGPRSYTKEDVTEINCHGGILVTRRILERILQAGARLSEPGEFTKRAFLNGRIDLTQAESVMSLIRSTSDLAAKNALSQLKGSLRDKVISLRKELIYEIAYLESALDDPENYDLTDFGDRCTDLCNRTLTILNELIASAENGRLMQDGIKVCILGKPNAGKSSFLNFLLEEERAIVTDIPGTTRDTVESTMRLGDLTLRLMDTAGLRETEDVIEQIGVERAREAAKNADLILYLIDSAVMPSEEELRQANDLIGEKPCIFLMSKADTERAFEKEHLLSTYKDISGLSEEKLPTVFLFSSKQEFTDETGAKIELREERHQLEQKIMEMFWHGDVTMSEKIVITNMRQKQHLVAAAESIKAVKRTIEDEMPEDLLAGDLMSAYSELGLIIGEEVEDDLVNEIFSKFCMGK